MLRVLNRVLNAIAFWFVAGLSLLVGSTAFGFHCTATISQAYVTATKSDLMTLSDLQENFRSRHGRYATAREAYAQLRNSTGVVLVIVKADASHWKALAFHEQLVNTSCAMESGDAWPVCTGQEPRREPLSIPTGNFALDFAIDLAGMAFALARRQRRLALG